MYDANITKQVRSLMAKGIYDPNTLFELVYRTNRVHYSKVREAIDHVKSF